MRIVIVNTSERKGGAATAAHRLYKALAKEGHDVFMLVRDKQSNDPQVFSINEKPATRCMNRIRFLWERLLIFITNRFNRKKLFRVSTGHGIDLSEHPLLLSADMVNEPDILMVNGASAAMLAHIKILPSATIPASVKNIKRAVRIVNYYPPLQVTTGRKLFFGKKHGADWNRFTT